MLSVLCLEYQARAKAKDQNYFWKIRYKPCLLCEQGKKVKYNKDKDIDADMEKLKSMRTNLNNSQMCKYCGETKPLTEFYESVKGSGRYCKECKKCAVARVIAADKAKRKAGIEEANVPENLTPAVELEKLLVDKKLLPINFRTCKRCGYTGPLEDFYNVGKSGITNICRQCVSKRKSENAQKEVPKLEPDQIILDFSEYREIKEQIELAARENFRTVNNEILFRLVRTGLS